jgi:hypothetical protein
MQLDNRRPLVVDKQLRFASPGKRNAHGCVVNCMLAVPAAALRINTLVELHPLATLDFLRDDVRPPIAHNDWGHRTRDQRKWAADTRVYEAASMPHNRPLVARRQNR